MSLLLACKPVDKVKQKYGQIPMSTKLCRRYKSPYPALSFCPQNTYYLRYRLFR